MRMAQWRAGTVPVAYRRVPCVRRGGLRFALQGNLLAAGVRDERGRRRRRRGGGRAERARRVGAHEPQLGRVVPGVRAARRPGAQLQGHLLHHPADCRRRRRRAGKLVPRAHVPGPRQLLLRLRERPEEHVVLIP